MRRRAGFLFICSAAVPIAIFASSAWACGVLTTITSDTKVAAPNQTITVSGRNFSNSSASVTPVELRWDSRTGTKLNDQEINVAGRAFSANVKVPSTAGAGWHVVNATQYNISTGAPVAGTPGRTTVRVQGAAVASTSPFGAAKPSSGGPGSPDLPLAGILLSVALLATGLTLVARGRGRKAIRPALSA